MKEIALLNCLGRAGVIINKKKQKTKKQKKNKKQKTKN